MFEVTCPCCGARLVIDDSAAKVVHHTRKEHVGKASGQRMDDILGKLEKDARERESKMNWAKARQAERHKAAEDLFKRAQEKVREEGDIGKPKTRPWD